MFDFTSNILWVLAKQIAPSIEGKAIFLILGYRTPSHLLPFFVIGDQSLCNFVLKHKQACCFQGKIMFHQKGLTLFSLSVKNTDFVTFYNLQNVGTKFSKKIILTNLFPKPKGYNTQILNRACQSVLLVMLTSCLHYARAINYNQDDQALLPLSQVLCENVFF